MKSDWPEIQVGLRTRRHAGEGIAPAMLRPAAPYIDHTTPESLNLMLLSRRRAGMLTTAKFLIVDEVHAQAGSKRGVFLSLVLERLEDERRGTDGIGETANRRIGGTKRGVKIAPGVYVPVEPVGDLIRVGLSATARPEETIARAGWRGVTMRGIHGRWKSSNRDSGSCWITRRCCARFGADGQDERANRRRRRIGEGGRRNA